MEKKAKLALCYTRNHHTMLFTVNNILEALQLANAIADSDLLNEDIIFNCFDLCVRNEEGEFQESWESEDGFEFNELWSYLR